MEASVYDRTKFEFDAIWHLEPVQLSSQTYTLSIFEFCANLDIQINLLDKRMQTNNMPEMQI